MHSQTERSITSSSAAEYRVNLLEPVHVHHFWGQIAPMLEKIGMEDHSLDTLYESLVDVNERVFLIAVTKDDKMRALIGVELIETRIGGRWLNVLFVTGKDTVEWLPVAVPTVLNWAKSHGCTKAMGSFRKFFKKYLKPLGWRHTHDHLEIDL